MGRTKNAKNLTDKQKKDFDRKRVKVVKMLPFNYSNLLELYCSIKGIDLIERKKVYNFVLGATYSEEILNTLTDFTIFIKNKSFDNKTVASKLKDLKNIY